MEKIIKENYILLNSVGKVFTNFLSEFEKEYTNVNKSCLVVNFSKDLVLNNEEILLFLPYSERHQQNGLSFVVVVLDVDVDAFPESFNIVPTLHEAEDVLEMEAIQRDLGF